MKNIENAKAAFKKPSVGEVFRLMEKAAINYELKDWKEVSRLFATPERTFRRWKSKAETAPELQSPIGFQSFALLYAAAEQAPYINTIEFDTSKIPEQLIMNAETFKKVGLSKDDIRLLVGLGIGGREVIGGQSLKTIASNVGISPNELSLQINDDKLSVSFATWALILMFYGVPVRKVLNISK